MLEKEVEKYFNQEIKKLGALSLKFVSPGKNGVPDRLVLYKGASYFVEMKKPGEKPRALQIKVHKEFEDQGFPVTTIDTKELVDKFIETIKKKIKTLNCH